VLWHHAVRGGLSGSETLQSANSISKQYAVGRLTYLACLGFTWISVPASIAANVLLAIFFAIPTKTRQHGCAPMHSATK
jgi:hypothetical protein